MVKSFILGSASKLAKSTEERCKMSWLGCHEGDSEADAQAWVESVKEDRYLSDVFK
jgi:cytochrome P450/NADPH-cytochrome P450 reductase